tara:strand:- start:782 stop:1366 length:585 start_codon:yes stop_codon:yes gene_type:complete
MKEFTYKNYKESHKEAFNLIDDQSIEKSVQLILDAISLNKKIITCGNGGSASTASHYITDWNKMYNLATGNKLRGVSLCDNVGLITAYGNDLNYESIFSEQINTLMDEGDLLIVISGSGNSPNILKAIDAAKRNGSKVLGVLGFDGGKALSMCDVVFHVPSWDMQICEDIHLSFGHIVMKTICNEPIKNKKNRR